MWGPWLTVCAYNDAYRPLFGEKPEPLGRSFLDVWSEARGVVAPQIARALKGENCFFEDAPFVVNRNGSPEETWFDYSFSPVYDPEGKVAGVLNIGVETTARHRTREALRENEHRLTLALDAAGAVGTWDWDVKNDVVHADPRFVALFGLDREKAAVGLPVQAYLDAIEPNDRQRVREAIEEAMRRGNYFSEEYRLLRKDGAEFWVLARGQCLFDESGNPDRFPGVAMDITEQKRSERRQSILMAELDHRVKNVLATVQSMTAQTLRGANADAAARFRGRLDALAQTHTLLAESRWNGASMRRLIAATISPHQGENDPSRVRFDGPDLTPTAEAAQPLSRTLHEFLTNAMKYGALSAPEGRVDIDWSLTGGDDARIVMHWRENGGPEIRFKPREKGFGTQLIDSALSYELDGSVEMDYRPSGLVATLTLPVAGLMSGAVPPPALLG